jgi:hypothetical protein
VDIEAVTLVLGQNDDASETAIHEIREGEVDQSVLTAVGHCRFGSHAGEGHEALASTTSENN